MPPSLKRILVTGFGPFKGYQENPSWLAAEKLNNVVISTNGKKVARVTSIMIPVVYQDILDTLPGLHASPPVLPTQFKDREAPIPYSLIVHMGVGDDGPLNVETVACKTGYYHPDIKQKLPDQVKGLGKRGFAEEKYAKFSEELKVGIDATEIVENAVKKGVKVITSKDAGRYLCEFIFYCSMAEAELAGNGCPAMFIHCSPLRKPMTTDEVVEGVQKILEEVCLYLKW